MMCIKEEFEKYFIMPLRTNRKIAMSKKDKLNGKCVTVSELELKQGVGYKIYLEAVSFPLLLIRQIFKNEDGNQGVLYLVSSNLSKTMESRRISQVIEVTRFIMQVFNEESTNTKQLYICVYLSFFQIGAIEYKIENKSECTKIENIYFSPAKRYAAFKELENMKVCYAVKF